MNYCKLSLNFPTTGSEFRMAPCRRWKKIDAFFSFFDTFIWRTIWAVDFLFINIVFCIHTSLISECERSNRRTTWDRSERVWTLSQSQTEIGLRSSNWRVWTLSQSKLASIRESTELNRKTKSKMRWWRDIFKEISRFTQKGLNMTDKFSWWLKDLLVQTTE